MLVLREELLGYNELGDGESPDCTRGQLADDREEGREEWRSYESV